MTEDLTESASGPESGSGSGAQPGSGSETAKGPNAWAQTIAALAVVGVLGGGLWLQGQSESASAVGPASCSSSKATHLRPSGHVSAAQLCTALNRSDLPTLLGTPAEEAQSAGSGESSSKLAGGTEIATPEATVTLKTYTVKLSASYDDLPVTPLAGLLTRGEKRSVLGHPAVLYSDRTIAISFNLNGDQSDAGPGSPVRALLVALDPKDGGGSYEIAVWREDAMVPDDAALLRVAEKVLPTVPGWTAG
jgi:hypothetical protein